MLMRTSPAIASSEASGGKPPCCEKSAFHSRHGLVQVQALNHTLEPGGVTQNRAPERCRTYLDRSASSQTVNKVASPDWPAKGKPICWPTVLRAPSAPMAYLATMVYSVSVE